jgi:hypothetical protein
MRNIPPGSHSYICTALTSAALPKGLSYALAALEV